MLALERARLRQANRVFLADGPVSVDALSTIEAPDILASRVLTQGS